MMAKVSIATLDTAAMEEPPSGSSGDVETRAYFTGERHPIHLQLHRLGPDATLRIDGGERDRLVYVWEGAIEAGGTRMDRGSSLVVEIGASLTVTAGSEGATVLSYNLRDELAEPRVGGHVHLMPTGIVPRTDSMLGSTIGAGIHFNAECPTCTLWLHENDFLGDHVVAPHSHSKDELIFIREGSIRLGTKLYPRGTAVLLQADTDYGFASGPDGMGTVDFRGGAPILTPADGSPVIDESEIWAKVGRPRYLPLETA
jgi:hypothetical protein